MLWGVHSCKGGWMGFCKQMQKEEIKDGKMNSDFSNKKISSKP